MLAVGVGVAAGVVRVGGGGDGLADSFAWWRGWDGETGGVFGFGGRGDEIFTVAKRSEAKRRMLVSWRRMMDRWMMMDDLDRGI